MTKKALSSFNNEMNVDYDKAGFCANCHIVMAEFDGFGIDQTPQIIRWLGMATKTRVVLDDGSKMDISICRSCSDKLESNDCGLLMESIIRGWHWEVLNKLPDWTPEKKEAYMAQYRKRYITNRDDAPWGVEDTEKMEKPREAYMDVRK